jgi:hypothetical protein
MYETLQHLLMISISACDDHHPLPPWFLGMLKLSQFSIGFAFIITWLLQPTDLLSINARMQGEGDGGRRWLEVRRS